MRRGNLLTLRKFFNWKSNWCSKYFYKSLLYKDLFLHFYLNSLFFKLRFNTSSVKINYFNNHMNICTFDIYTNSFSRFKKYYYFFFKRLFSILKTLKYFLITFHSFQFKTFLNNLPDYLIIDLYYLFKFRKYNYFKTLYIISKFIRNLYKFFTYKYVSFFLKLSLLFIIKDIFIKKLFFFKRNLRIYYNSLINILKEKIVVNLINLNNHYVELLFFKKITIPSFLNYNFKNFFNEQYILNYIITNYLFKKLNYICTNFYMMFNIFFYKLPILSKLYNNKYKIKDFKLNNFFNIKYNLNSRLENFFFKKKYILLNFLKINMTILPKNYIVSKTNFISILKKLKRNIYYYFSVLNNKKYFFIYWLFLKCGVLLFNNFYLRYSLNYYFNNINFNYINNLYYKIYKQNYNCVQYFNILNTNLLYFYKNINFFIKLKNITKFFNIDIKNFKLKKFLKTVYFNQFIKNIIFFLEKSLYIYSSKNIIYILLPNIFFFHKPFINSAKLLSDYLYFKLKKRLTIYKVYNKLKKWQIIERSLVTITVQNLIGRLNFFSKKKYTSFIIRFRRQLKVNLIFKKSINTRLPLKGIRCLCSGPAYKARRKTRRFYHLWIANYTLTGSMSLQQLRYKIDYHQTFIVLKRATIGLKVWLLLESYIKLK